MTAYQIYLALGLLVLGLIDLYLNYPFFHPIILLTIAGWLVGDLGVGLIVGGILELIFGIAQIKWSRRLNLILYAGGLAIYLNLKTHNINLIFCLTLGLIIAFIIQLIIEKVDRWLQGVVVAIFSALLILLIPYGSELLGYIPAQVLNKIAVAGGILPWIFYAYAIKELADSGKGSQVIYSIPAIMIGSELAVRGISWAPLVFIAIYYSSHYDFKSNYIFIYWVHFPLVIGGMYIYLNLFSFSLPILFIFTGIVGLNMLFIARHFAPFEIYLLNFLAGIILSHGGLLT